jgi:hypothetical protein
MIIRGGRSVPYELEEAIGNLDGIRKGCVAVVGVMDTAAGTERLIAIAEVRSKDAADREALRTRINALGIELLGSPPDEVVLAPPNTVLKTSSGKIRRAATPGPLRQRSDRTARGGFRWQVARLAIEVRAPRSVVAFGVSGQRTRIACLGRVRAALSVAPDRCGHRRATTTRMDLCRFIARVFFRLAGIPIRTRGLEHTPAIRLM